MSTRLSRRAAIAVGMSIVVMMVVWAPMMAFADSSDSASAPGDNGKSADAHAAAPGQQADATETDQTVTADTSATTSSNSSSSSSNASSTSTAKKADAPGVVKKSASSGGSGNNVPASNLDDGVGGGVGNSENQDKDRPNTSNGPGTGQEPADDCTNPHQGADPPQGGANQNPGPYDNTCDGRPSDNGQGGGLAKGRPCMGCVGNADDKNPPGQFPNGKSDRKNRGYECDDNNGVGKGNPAHTTCKPDDSNPPPEPDCDNDGIPDDQDTDNSGCDNPPPPDCDNDGIDDNVDPDITSCEPPPPGSDCDGDGVPDDVDSDNSGCDPVQLCPDGEVMTDAGCGNEVLPDLVLGTRFTNDPPSAVAPKAVAPGVLPFTGGNLLPFLMLSVGLIATGGVAMGRKQK